MRLKIDRGTSLVALAASLLVAPKHLSAASVQQVLILSEQCASGKQNACLELTRVALKDKQNAVRLAAVGRLDDQGALMRVALESDFSNVRKAAVERLTDLGLVFRLALDAKDEDARIAAVGKLAKDEAMLMRVALEGNYADAGVAAVSRLKDQKLLAHVMVDAKDKGVRDSAGGRLATDLINQAILGHAAAVRNLLDLGVPVDAKNDTGRTALMFACSVGNRDVVQVLLCSRGGCQCQKRIPRLRSDAKWSQSLPWPHHDG
jgi:hypothetical protein